MAEEPIIGIVGGLGPYAGLDLARKVFDQTLAARDQDHLPVLVFSLPGKVADRTEYLLGRTDANPAEAVGEMLVRLAGAGAAVAGIACNTAHAPPIFDVIVRRLAEGGSAIRLLHMIEEVARHLRQHYPSVTRLGLLATTGTCRAGVYPDVLGPKGFEVIGCDEDVQEGLVHRSIYDARDGIKARADPVTAVARAWLTEAVSHLRARGAEAVILGCTEIPLALPERQIDGVPLIDPALVLARALIRETYPRKLKPLEQA